MHRIGHGYDIHRLQPGGQLILGGIPVAQNIRPVSHSDGDVVIHAIVDAILGALALGDIGEHFPDTDPAYKNAPSKLFLQRTIKLMQGKGYVATNCDVTVLLEQPRLKPFKPQMSAFLEQLLSCPVNIKAGTNEGCGEIGRGEAIAAHAVILLTSVNPSS